MDLIYKPIYILYIGYADDIHSIYIQCIHNKNGPKAQSSDESPSSGPGG